MPTLFLMVGYPGSGKTTAAKIIHTLTGAVHMWADHERNKRFVKPKHTHQENITLYAALNQEVQQLLHQGRSVIFDTNFNFYRDRQKLRTIAKIEGAETVVVWVKATKELARERATRQSHGKPTRVWGNMPVEHFERIAGGLEEPQPHERVITLDGTNVTEQTVAAALAQIQQLHQ